MLRITQSLRLKKSSEIITSNMRSTHLTLSPLLPSKPWSLSAPSTHQHLD